MKHSACAILCLLLGCRAATAPAPAPAPAPTPAQLEAQAQLEELHALAELTGLVRFFHPSDEAAATPWDLFVVHAAAELLALFPRLRPDEAGPVVWLIDGGAISTGETMLLPARAGQQTMVGPRPTAGADGENRWFILMGGWRVAFTGEVARKMDGTPLWREGLVPDIVVPLTPDGLAAGRDEVLEAALEHLKKAVEVDR